MSRSGKRLRNTRPKEGEKDKPFFKTGTPEKGTFFQAKPIRVGRPGDKYEKEADAVANRVSGGSEGGAVVQEKEISKVQRESLATPLEDEKLGTAEQRMEEDKLVQEQADESMEEEEMVQAQEEEEEMVQAQEEEEEMVQAQEEEEEMVQAKSSAKPATAPKPVASSIQQASGKGKPLSGKVKKQMEKALSVDLSKVRIHTDEEAAYLCKKLKAHAFTFGKDVFFNTGKYQPEKAAGKKLLAHELTHVVQQHQAKKKKN